MFGNEYGKLTIRHRIANGASYKIRRGMLGDVEKRCNFAAIKFTAIKFGTHEKVL